jgi:hypothetical protein
LGWEQAATRSLQGRAQAWLLLQQQVQQQLQVLA